jgi:hypothetical protein
MILSHKRWKRLLFFCIGLSIGTGLCMKWMETLLVVNGEKFTILGLELFYTKDKLVDIFANLDDGVATILDLHLHFDFIFMAGIFPGITSLCMIAREKVASTGLRKILFILAASQLLAWAGDIAENLFLIKWLAQPVPEIGNEFGLYHAIVAAKWIIALTAFLFSVCILLVRYKTKNR